jgi:monoterpene epsilon-lactone hydrolase
MVSTHTDRDNVRRFWEALVADPAASLEDTRARFDELCEQFEIPADASIEHVEAEGVPSLAVAAPGASPSRVALWLHSGGYCIGSAAATAELAYRVSRATGSTVLLPDYRLAPENPFPAALDDATAAYMWAVNSPGVEEVTLMGDSAGGGLAIALAVHLRDSRLPAPKALIALSPLTDLAGEGESTIARAELDPIPLGAMVANFGAAYLNGRDPKGTALASPLYAELHDLPPTLILVGTHESLYDDSTRIVDKLASAGTEVEFLIAEGMTHIWPVFPFLEQSAAAVARIGGFVQSRRLG